MKKIVQSVVWSLFWSIFFVITSALSITPHEEPIVPTTANYEDEVFKASNITLQKLFDFKSSSFVLDDPKAAHELNAPLAEFIVVQKQAKELMGTIEGKLSNAQRLAALDSILRMNTQGQEDAFINNQEHLTYFVQILLADDAKNSRTTSKRAHLYLAACLRTLLSYITADPKRQADNSNYLKDIYSSILEHEIPDTIAARENQDDFNQFAALAQRNLVKANNAAEVNSIAAQFFDYEFRELLYPQIYTQKPKELLKNQIALFCKKLGLFVLIYQRAFSSITNAEQPKSNTTQNILLLSKIFCVTLVLQNVIETKKLGKTALRALINSTITTILSTLYSDKSQSIFAETVYKALSLIWKKNFLEMSQHESNMEHLKWAIIASVAACSALAFVATILPVLAPLGIGAAGIFSAAGGIGAATFAMAGGAAGSITVGATGATTSATAIKSIGSAFFAEAIGEKVVAKFSHDQPQLGKSSSKADKAPTKDWQTDIENTKRALIPLLNTIVKVLILIDKQLMERLKSFSLVFITTKSWASSTDKDVIQERMSKFFDPTIQKPPEEGEDRASEPRDGNLEERLSKIESRLSALEQKAAK